MSSLRAKALSHRESEDWAAHSQEGFTLIEVMVAITVMVLAFAVLGVVLTGALAAVSNSRQSQQATNLADAVIAQDEALPWTTISDGLVSTDTTFTGDEGTSRNIVPGTGGYCFEGLFVVVGGAVPTSCNGTSTTWYPLPSLGLCGTSVAPSTSFPVTGSSYLAHETCVQMNGTDFEVGIFPTEVSGATPSTEVQVTVAVSWGSGTTSSTGTDTHVSDSAIITCGTTDGLSNGASCS
jgi:prepilin-type N-terminal cleavage/methylation domain-containing protein